MPVARYVVLALLLGAALAGTPATAAPTTATPTPGAATTSHATPAARTAADDDLRGVITFNKNRRNPHRSTLVWRLWRLDGRKRALVEHRSWRAGSGFTKHSVDPCKKNDGWLPNGGYRPRLHANYWGNLIKGRAIYLGAKRCGNGTLRTDLFIHTEQGDRNTQCPDRTGDQVCRWEYPKINDYRSWGCIKVSPRHMRQLFDAWRAHFDLGYDDRVRVRVIA